MLRLLLSQNQGIVNFELPSYLAQSMVDMIFKSP